jgi:hypothetical protein
VIERKPIRKWNHYLYEFLPDNERKQAYGIQKTWETLANQYKRTQNPVKISISY